MARAWILAVGVSLIGIAAGAAAPNANVTSPRTSCVAPCAIFFDARGSNDSDLNRNQELVDLVYSWDFGDPGSGTWAEGARAQSSVPHSRNKDAGFVAGHVYESPGSYTATLTLTDGTSTDTDTILVSIQNPNSVWSGSNTVCIAATTTPVAGSGGCPAGAAVARSADFDAALAAHGCLNSARRCLFRRGDSFVANQSNTFTTGGPAMVGAYGSGPKPRVTSTASVHVFRFGQGNSDTRVADLQIVGPNQPGLGGGAALAIYGQGVSIHRFLGLRLDISHFDDQIHFRGSNGTYTPGVNMPDQVAIVDSTVLDGPGLGGNDVFVMWERSLFLGNRVGDKFDGAHGLGEHVLRAKFSHGVVYAHNSMGLLTDSGGRIGCGTIRVVMKVVSGFAIDVGEAGVSREHIISDNYISACKGNALAVDVGRTDSTAQKIPEGQRNFIVERNFFTNRFNTSSSPTSMNVEGDGGMVRNNVFDLSGSYHDSTPRGVRVWNRAPVSNPPIPTQNVRVYNNSCFEDGATPGDGICVHVEPSARATIVKNNVLFDAGPGRPGGPARLLYNGGVGTVTCSGCNVTRTSTPFVSSNPGNVAQYAPSGSSVLVDAGEPLPAAPIGWTTFLGPLDGDHNGVARIDVGAWERDGDPPTGGGGGGGGGGTSPPAAPILLP